MGIDLTGFGGLGAGIKSVADLAKDIIDRVSPPDLSAGEKAEATLKLQEMLDKRETGLISAQRDIMVAEMAQSDTWTKRARPSIVYAGLLFIFLVHVAFPIFAFFGKQEVPNLTMPTEFWFTWGGVCSVWIIGRSREKIGAVAGPLQKMIMGQ